MSRSYKLKNIKCSNCISFHVCIHVHQINVILSTFIIKLDKTLNSVELRRAIHKVLAEFCAFYTEKKEKESEN